MIAKYLRGRGTLAAYWPFDILRPSGRVFLGGDKGIVDFFAGGGGGGRVELRF